jgi:5'-3' exonuclease
MLGSDVPGEGEIKIVKYIQHKPLSHTREDTYLIVGTDVDLILLGESDFFPFDSLQISG